MADQYWQYSLWKYKVVPRPLPENREQPTVGKFVEMHEQAHAKLHHAILRNLVKVAFALCAIWFMAALMVRWECSIVESVLWLHLAAIPFRLQQELQ